MGVTGNPDGWSRQCSWVNLDIDNGVLVIFEAGDPANPYEIGLLWNGQDSHPETMDSNWNNNRRLIRIRSGLQLLFNNAQGN